MSSSPAITADGATNHSRSILESENDNPVGASLKETSSATTRTPETRRGGRRDGRDHDGSGGVLNLHNDRNEACVTLAITTCKRLQLFLGTAAGLQVRYLSTSILVCSSLLPEGMKRYIYELFRVLQ